jgi:signal transduction histidine kinase/ActR/RegA family two-component response regulator
MTTDSPNEVNAVHDIRETVKRTARFGYVAMLFAGISIITNLYYGNYLSASLVGGLLVCLLFIITLNFKGWFTVAKIFSVVSINTFLTIIAFSEGLHSGGYLFFIPLLTVLPYLIDNHERYLEELSAYLAITIACFCACIFYCPEESTWQVIPDDIYARMFLNNSLSVILISASYAIIGLFMERRYVETIIHQKQKTEEAAQARAKFLSNMGHELRTPLNGIIGVSNLLEKEDSLPHQEEYLNILKYCSDHMLRLVNDILDFNKIEAGKLNLHPIDFNLKTLLQKSTLPFYNHFEEKGIHLKVEVDPAVNLTVHHDDLRLVQILNNILANALKFTEKGYVELKAAVISKTDEVVTVHFKITDTGIGIAPDDQRRIFDSFWQASNHSTRRFGGTGLGLTISQRLLQLMNSSLQVNSVKNKGSEFAFTIDFALSKNIANTSSLIHDTNDLRGYRILVAEDNIINMMIAKKMLLDWRAEVVTAENGAEAIEILVKDAHFDIILLDLEMPEVDGYTAIKEIRKSYPDIPAIAFTAALLDNEMLQSLIKMGFVDCALKPFIPQELLSKIKNATAASMKQPVL